MLVAIFERFQGCNLIPSVTFAFGAETNLKETARHSKILNLNLHLTKHSGNLKVTAESHFRDAPRPKTLLISVLEVLGNMNLKV